MTSVEMLQFPHGQEISISYKSSNSWSHLGLFFLSSFKSAQLHRLSEVFPEDTDLRGESIPYTENLLREHQDQYNPSVNDITNSWLVALVISLNWVVISLVNIVKNWILFVYTCNYYMYLNKRKRMHVKYNICLVGTLKVCDFTYKCTCKLSPA